MPTEAFLLGATAHSAAIVVGRVGRGADGGGVFVYRATKTGGTDLFQARAWHYFEFIIQFQCKFGFVVGAVERLQDWRRGKT